MRITIQYWKGREHGSGENSTEYNLSVTNAYEDEIKIEFNFKSDTRGKTTNHDNQSYIKKGEIRLPKRQAMALASAILAACQPLEHNKKTSIDLEINEYDLIHYVEQGVTSHILAGLIGAKSNDVLEELEKQMQHKYLSLDKLIKYLKPSVLNKKEESRQEIYEKVQQIIQEIKLEILKNSYVPLKIVKSIQTKLTKK